MRFIINPNGHYFIIAESVDMKGAPYAGCQHFDSQADMLAAVTEQQGLALDEIEGSEFVIDYRADSHQLVCTDDRGGQEEVGELGPYLIQYEL